MPTVSDSLLISSLQRPQHPQPRRRALARKAPRGLLSLFGLLVATALCLPLPTRAEEAAAIGQVAFVVGKTEVERAGKRLPLAKGQALQEGDWIHTGSDGHAHLRMNDQGFIAVRPGSRLQIRHYAYHPENPAANQIQLQLDAGVARTVSGKAGEANKEKYRFNTPLAAIGLRGTDYVVQAQDDATRVSVLKGAVSVSPLGNGCQAEALAPCHNALTRELTAQNPLAYLEVRLRGNTPEVILLDNGKDNPARSTPPRPEEPRATLDKEATSARLAGSLPQPQVQPLPPALPPTIVWGRWSSVPLETPSVASQFTADREVTYANDLFALFRPNSPVTLPSGRISLQLDGGEAWLRNAQGQLSPVALSNGSLALDFNQRQFQTGLTAHTGEGAVPLQAQGNISFQGFLNSDPARSNTNVQGAINNQAQEAGYVFDRRLENGTLLGATHWKR